MKILVTNDDGILAPGIKILANTLKQLGSVTVIAPDRNNSGISSAISLETPLRVVEVQKNWYQLNGTPADCIKLGLSGFLSDQPDIVISGINSGANLGDDVLYSGTVGGAFEGRYLKYPPIAVSCVNEGYESDCEHGYHFQTAADQVIKIINRMILNNNISFPKECLLNINVPSLKSNLLKGTQITRQGSRHFSEPLMRHKDGRDKTIFWQGKAGKVNDGQNGTDFCAVKQGYVSITPMKVDLTDHDFLKPFSNQFQNHYEK